MYKISEVIVQNNNRSERSRLTPTIIYWIFFINSMCWLFTSVPNIVIFFIRMAIGSISIVYCLLHNKLRNSIMPLVFIFVYTMFGILSNIYNGNADLIELCWPVAFMGLGILIINYIPSISLTKWFLLLFYSICGIHYYIYGMLDATTLKSVNSINVMLFMLYSLLVISIYFNENYASKPLTLLLFSVLSLLCVLVSVGRSGGGRSGVIIFTLILISNLVFLIFNQQQHKKVHKLSIIVVFLVLLVLIFSCTDGLIYDRFSYLQTRGFSSPRILIWIDYIKIATESLSNLLLGADYMFKTELLEQFSENLHNSLLMLHAKYTLFMVFIVIMFMIYSFYFYLKKKAYALVVCLIMLFIRMNLDYTNFNAPLDTILVCFLFIPFAKYTLKGMHKC